MMQKQEFTAYNQIFHFTITVYLNYYEFSEPKSNIEINTINDKDQKHQLKIYNKNLSSDFKFFISDIRSLYTFLKSIFQTKQFKSCQLERNLLKINVTYTLQTGQKKFFNQVFTMQKINEIDKVKKSLNEYSKSLLQVKQQTSAKMKNLKGQFKHILREKIEALQIKHNKEMSNLKQQLFKITTELINIQTKLKKTKFIQKSPKKKQHHPFKEIYQKNGKRILQNLVEVPSISNSQSPQKSIKLQNQEQGQRVLNKQQMKPEQLYKETEAIIKQIKRKNGQLSPLHELSEQEIHSSLDAFSNKAQANFDQLQQSEKQKQNQKLIMQQENIKKPKRKKEKKIIPINAEKITFKFLKSKNKFGRFFQINEEKNQIRKLVTPQNAEKWHSLISSKPFPSTGIHYTQIRIVKSQLYNIVLGILNSQKQMVLNEIPDTCDAIYIQDGGLHDQIGGRLKKIQNKNEWRVKDGEPLDLNVMDEWLLNGVFFVIMKVNMDEQELSFWYNDLLISKTKFCKAIRGSKDRLHMYLALQNEDDTIQLC